MWNVEHAHLTCLEERRRTVFVFGDGGQNVRTLSASLKIA